MPKARRILISYDGVNPEEISKWVKHNLKLNSRYFLSYVGIGEYTRVNLVSFENDAINQFISLVKSSEFEHFVSDIREEDASLPQED